MEFVLIANSKGRESFLGHDRITRILCPAIQATCNLTQEQTRFFPTPPPARGTFGGRLTSPPRRSLPAQPATPAQTPTCSSAPHRLDNHPDTLHPSTGDLRGLGHSQHDTEADAFGYSPTGTNSRSGGGGYTSSQPLPNMANIPAFPSPPNGWTSTSPDLAPVPYPWQPKFLPEQWVYTDGSTIEGQPRLGAAVVHIPTGTTIYIDAA